MNLSKNHRLVRRILLLLLPGTIILSCNQNQQATQKQNAQEKLSAPAKQLKEMPIWTVAIPDAELIIETETYDDGMIKNVSNPTIRIYSPTGNNTGKAGITNKALVSSNPFSESFLIYLRY